jgi:putative ABC transport system permease protein
VTPGYLEALRVPLVRGRSFTDSDAPPAPPVVIVDEQLANRFWPNADPIGRRMYLPRGPEELAKPTPDTRWMRIVGVVKSVKLKGLVEGEDARVGAYYLPYASDPRRNIGFAIRTSGMDPIAITQAVNGALTSIDPETQLFDTFAMSERIERSLNPRRAPMLLSLGFGVVALLLASIGIYGLVSFSVTVRRREVGLRTALGGSIGEVTSTLVRHGLVLVAAGVAIGLALALMGTRIMEGLLFGVRPQDPLTFGATTALVLAISAFACWLPAWRAARRHPMLALRQE